MAGSSRASERRAGSEPASAREATVPAAGGRVTAAKWLLGHPQSWGVLDQGFSSVTNLGLSVVAARLSHTSGLGVVSVGFGAYVLALVVQRALVTDPLTVHAARLEPAGARVALERGLLITSMGAVAMTGVVVIIGFAAGGHVGHGMLLFTPWIPSALFQDFWRWSLFRAGRGSAAALNDGVWVAAMAASLPLVLLSSSEWVIVACWGVGATAGAVLGWFQLGTWHALRMPRSAFAPTWSWWRQEILPLGRWLGLESMCVAVVGLVVPALIISILSSEALGGLRAVDTIFAPMSLIGQGIELPWLPQLSRDWAQSKRRARLAASRASALAIALLIPYLIVVVVFRGELLATVFGPGFGAYGGLVLPVAATQLGLAGSIGYLTLLKAAGRGQSLLVARGVGSGAVIALVAALSATGGLVWAAWGRMVGSVGGELIGIGLALRRDRDEQATWVILPVEIPSTSRPWTRSASRRSDDPVEAPRGVARAQPIRPKGDRERGRAR